MTKLIPTGNGGIGLIILQTDKIAVYDCARTQTTPPKHILDSKLLGTLMSTPIATALLGGPQWSAKFF